MAKYRISIENIGEGASWNEEDVLECDGFMILGNQPEGVNSWIHDISDIDAAKMMATAEQTHTIMILAQAMIEAGKVKAQNAKASSLAALLRELREEND